MALFGLYVLIRESRWQSSCHNLNCMIFMFFYYFNCQSHQAVTRHSDYIVVKLAIPKWEFTYLASSRHDNKYRQFLVAAPVC